MEWSPAERSPGRNYHFMVSAVAPRPIAWVTTMDGPVVNVAPFSWFQSICADPPLLMIAFADRDGGLKDTCRNIIGTGEFTLNAATEELAETMVATSGDYPRGTSEAEALGIGLVPAAAVAPPRIAASPYHLECRLVENRRWGAEKGTTVVIGEVVHIHARDEVLDERGNIDNRAVPLMARLGGNLYTATDRLRAIDRPTVP